MSVLVIDNSNTTIIRLREFFEPAGFSLVGVHGAFDGIREVYKGGIELIILDSVIDQLGGFDVAEYLKSTDEFKYIPIIMYSSVYDSKHSILKKRSGIDLLINKGDIEIQKLYEESIHLIGIKKIISKEQISEYPGDNRVLSTLRNQNDINSISIEIINALFSMYSMTEDEPSRISETAKIFFDYFRIKRLYLYYNLRNESSFYYFSVDNDGDEFIEDCFHNLIYDNFDLDYLNTKHVKKRIFKEIKGVCEKNEKSSLSNQTVVVDGSEGNSIITVDYFEMHSEEYLLLMSALEYFKNAISSSIVLFNTLNKKNELKNGFKKFLPEKIINDLMMKKTDEALMTGEKRNITVLFSHIRDFNLIEKNSSAEDIVNFLNTHFTLFSRSIRNFGGEINKYIGDAVFAMFGAPESFEDNSARAIRSAFEMLLRVAGNKLPQMINGDENYKVGIGIHKGDAIIGNIGSTDNFDYTAIGDTVNLAARLESLNKFYGTDILISREVYEEAISYKTPFIYREIDTIKVKGKEHPTTIYSVELFDNYNKEFKDYYKKGISMFKLGNWHLAKDFFCRAVDIESNDSITHIYLERINKFMIDPPQDWDGSYKLDFK